jgi:hypothetical protein
VEESLTLVSVDTEDAEIAEDVEVTADDEGISSGSLNSHIIGLKHLCFTARASSGPSKPVRLSEALLQRNLT